MVRDWLLPWSLGAVAYGGASLLVPLYVVELGGDAFDLGVLAAVAAAVGVPSAVVVGRRIDRSRRFRPYVLAILAVTVAMLATIPLLESIPLVIAANAVIWLTFAAATPVLTLLVVADAPAHAWSEHIARLNEYQGIGWALGLALGTAWTLGGGLVVGDRLALQTCFGVLAAVGLVGTVSGARWFPRGETVEAGVRLRTALRLADGFDVRSVTFPFTVARVDLGGLSPRRLARRFSADLVVYFVAIVAMFTGFAAFFAPLPAFLAEVGLSAGAIFALYLVTSATAAVCFASVGRLAARYDVTLLQAAGLILRGVAIPMVALAALALGADAVGLGTLVALFAAIGVSWAVIIVTAGTLVASIAPIAVRGEALGVYAALTALAGGIGALAGGALGSRNFLLAFSVAGGLILVAAALVFGLRRDPIATARSAATGEDFPPPGW